MTKRAWFQSGSSARFWCLLGLVPAMCGSSATLSQAAQLDIITSFNEKVNYPLSNLLPIGGDLYGIAAAIAGNYGTIYKITPDGKLIRVHVFGNNPTVNRYPTGDLLSVDGAIYGVTGGDGITGEGSIYKITPAGTETVLHAFRGHSVEGARPDAGPILVDGVLYGTTYAGGGPGCRFGCGAVYKINPDGTGYKQLYAFQRPDQGSGDGQEPGPPLLEVGGVLYGTTWIGGKHNAGTVFKITKDGHETVLPSFEGDTKGQRPESGLIFFNNALYGTTSQGGRNGAGTIFSIGVNGDNFKIVRWFGGYGDGKLPTGNLTYFGPNKIYGAALNGGFSRDGVIFLARQEQQIRNR